jgi:Polyketide cyclase / dehydrase and lipid transport
MWYMRPIQVSIDVPQACEDVYEFLDVLANHEQFTDHMMRNWRLQGPERGVGAKARLDAVLGGRSEPIDIEVIEADPPIRNVERNVGAGGRRVATGSYTLDPLPDGGTRIRFEYAWQQIPVGERLAAPIIRRVTRRALQTAMQRLAEQLRVRCPIAASGLS